MAYSGNFLIRCLLLVALLGSIFIVYFTFTQNKQDTIRKFHLARHLKFNLAVVMKNESEAERFTTGTHPVQNELPTVSSPFALTDDDEYSVQIFYYPWYGNPKFDHGKYYHWNHRFLSHWDPTVVDQYPRGVHSPPSDIGSSFYPLLGPYSSRNPAVIEQHMKWMSSAGIDVVIVSWFPPRTSDEQGYPWDDLIPVLLDAVAKYRMKLSFHMEPYKERSGESLRNDIEYIIDNYGNHSAFYKVKRKLRKRLLVKSEDRYSLLAAGFDGIYTYFAAKGFSYGSTPSNWPSLSSFCRKNNLIFIPSVGPGYDDHRVRPWNKMNYNDRMNGKYYADMFEMAHVARANIITITSFNEWHEGTQIEPAISFTDNSTGFVYNTYAQGPEQYLHQTLDLIKKKHFGCFMCKEICLLEKNSTGTKTFRFEKKKPDITLPRRAEALPPIL
uniref:Glycoprotein endo-alpha-1,2-mannosidase n=1 Tax=Setaria digitata TaxID=48799 RepID=A0A915PZ73_9BILA